MGSRREMSGVNRALVEDITQGVCDPIMRACISVEYNDSMLCVMAAWAYIEHEYDDSMNLVIDAAEGDETTGHFR